MLTLIVARHQEDVSWLNLVTANVVVVNKAMIGNTGREASSYLWFIVRHYESLAGDYLFCQGDPYPHCADFDAKVAALGSQKPEARSRKPEQYFGPRFRCDWDGVPNHPGLDLRGLAGALELTLPPELEFTASAQFVRSADELRARPRSYYERALDLANTRRDAAWGFERLWDYLIPTC